MSQAQDNPEPNQKKEAPSQPQICKGGCGFWGNPVTDNYCSICHKKLFPNAQLDQQKLDNDNNNNNNNNDPSKLNNNNDKKEPEKPEQKKKIDAFLVIKKLL